jgi:hypothetical protein
MSSASRYQSIPCPGLPPEACEALNAWSLDWQEWGREVVTFLQQTAEWAAKVDTLVIDKRGLGGAGVPPPPPPPPPREPAPMLFRLPIPEDPRGGRSGDR